jgi:GntR family phosphonate transport system transcriptional regulator
MTKGLYLYGDNAVTQTHLSQGSAHPQWRRIADDLIEAMDRGEFVAGDALPTAIQLSERYGVHRHTVRQAFRYLAEQGRVSVEQGRGTFVTAERIPYKLGRRVSFRTNLQAAGLTTSGRVLESAVIPSPAPIARVLRLAPGAPIWSVRNVSEADGVPLSTSIHYLSAERFPDFATRLAEADGSISAAFASYGIAAYERLSTRLHARGATAEEATILGLTEGAPVLHSTGLDGLASGTPLQLAETAFPGERVEMVVAPE